MNRAWTMMLVMFCPWLALAQPAAAQYQPAVPAPSANVYGGGWGGYSTPTTAAGSAMSGMSQVISAAGQYNLSTSAAAVNMTQAQKQEMENRQQWTNTYFDMRATNKKAREAERGPRPTMEQLTRLAQEGVPKQLSPGEMDPVSGKIAWPVLLQADDYAAQRGELEQLLAKRASYGALDLADQTKARQATDAMFAMLKSQIRQVPPQDYTASRSFLNSVLYTTCRTELD